ncbi:MAG TPA: TauD/TfdA family dioxygenase [Nevskiaceae bacterium]|nr:TauD/TfdA family dioxygenase [Nevskiaceae bacterium]
MYKSLRAQTLHYFARPHEGPLTRPLQTPAAWRGDEMASRTDWQVHLAPHEIDELKSAVAHAESTHKPMGAMTRADFPLPTLAARLADWRREIRHGRGFVLIRGVPVAQWSEQQSEIAYWCMGHHLGIPGSQNPQNDLLGHVRDQRTTGDVRYYRTNKALAVHTDTADVVGLLCLKKAKSGGLSRIAPSVTVFNEVLRRRPDLAPRLFQPLYFDTKGEGGVQAFPVAPCTYADGELRTFWQSDYYREAQRFAHVPRLTDDERALLDLYDEIANSPEIRLDMDLEPGDIQLISNHTILHARTAFEDFPELENRRHLLRLWISLPEAKPLKQRLLTWQSLGALSFTAVRELASAKLRGQQPAAS